jgi:hypothetical protein
VYQGDFFPFSEFVLFDNKYFMYIVSPHHGHYYSFCFHLRKYRRSVNATNTIPIPVITYEGYIDS